MTVNLLFYLDQSLDLYVDIQQKILAKVKSKVSQANY